MALSRRWKWLKEINDTVGGTMGQYVVSKIAEN
jgi:hypothetical protein